MTAHERNLVRRSERFALVNECKHNMTKKGRFARSFLSTDHPDAKGIVYDYGDCCREVRRMLQKMDAPVREAIRDRRFAEAIKALKDHPALKRTLRTIRRLAGCDEKEIAKALGIKPDTYYKRFDRICEILSISVPRKKIFTSQNAAYRKTTWAFCAVIGRSIRSQAKFHVRETGKILN